jgi:hypothetical protein
MRHGEQEDGWRQPHQAQHGSRNAQQEVGRRGRASRASSFNKKSAPDGIANKKSAADCVSKRSATDEDDVEGHSFNKKSAPDGIANKKSAPDGVSKRSATDEDDVEGHSFGTMNPLLARDLARSKDRDIERSASRNNLVSEAKRGTTRKP